MLLLGAGVLGALEVTRQVEQEVDVPGAEVEQLGEVAIAKVVGHALCLGSWGDGF